MTLFFPSFYHLFTYIFRLFFARLSSWFHPVLTNKKRAQKELENSDFSVVFLCCLLCWFYIALYHLLMLIMQQRAIYLIIIPKTHSIYKLLLKFDISLQTTRSANFNHLSLPDTRLYHILCSYRQKWGVYYKITIFTNLWSSAHLYKPLLYYPRISIV